MTFSAAYVRQPLAALLAIGLMAPVLAAGKPAPTVRGSRLEGRVLGPDGKPVRGAVVTVRGLDGEASWQSLPSDTGGRFRLQALPYGWVDLAVATSAGVFLGDQTVNLPPGTKVVVNFSLQATPGKPTSWWADRGIERPAGVRDDQVAGIAQSTPRLTGAEYWKSPAGIAIVASVAVVALGLIATSGRKSSTLTTP